MSISGIGLSSCRLCKSSNLYTVIDFGKIPLGNNLNFSLKEALNADKFPLVVNRCNACGHFQLSFSVDKEVLYQRDYSYLSSIGKSFVDHLNWSAKNILALENIQNKNIKELFVIDIGSNDGTALSFFKDKGCRVLGVDPSNLPVKEALKKEIKTVNDFFNHSLSETIIETEGKADIVISHNVLAHVENLKDIFSGIFNLLKRDGVFIFEVGYFANMINDGIYDTIYHEHLDYHTLKPIIKFLNSIGFSIFNAEIVSSQGGSIRIYCNKTKVVMNNNKILANLFELEAKLLSESEIKKWKENIFNNAKDINQIISQVIKRKGKIYGYGAPTKATLTCKIIDIENQNIIETLDDNKIKVGRYLPVNGIPIVSNYSSVISDKDMIVCFAWNFIEAIIENIRKKYGKNIYIISTQNGKVFKT